MVQKMAGCDGVCSTCAWYDIEKKLKEQMKKTKKDSADKDNPQKD